MKKHTSAALAAVVVGALLLTTACSGGGGPAPDTSGTPVQGGTLAIGVSADIVETIPSAIAQYNTRTIMANIYDQLVSEPKTGVTPEPSLATEWTVSDDRLTYTFTLRDDVTFHNGEPMTSADVVWSLDYARKDPNTASDLANIAEVKAPDATHVDVILSRPQPDLLIAFEDPSMGILPKDFGGATEDAFRAHPIGTGPFMWKNRTVGTDITFDRNADYWGQVPYVDGLHFKVFSDVNAESVALQSGDIDIANNVSLDSVPLMQGEVVKTADQLVEMLQLNSNTPALQDEKFRRALSLGIDRDQLVESLMGGYGTPASSILSITSFPEGLPKISDTPYTFDATEATALLGESSYDGTPLRLIYSTGIPTDASFAAALQAEWKKIGIEIELKPLESGEWLKAVTAPSPHDEFDLSISRAGGASATPQFGFLIASQYFGGGWPTDDVEKAAADYSAGADAAAQQKALADYEQELSASLKTITIAYMGAVSVTRDNVHGLTPRASQYLPLNTVYLSK